MSAAELERARRRSEPLRSVEDGQASRQHVQPPFTECGEGFRMCVGVDRVYEVHGITRSPSHLRCAVRACRGPRIHVDSLDLYSARARQGLMRACTDLFEVDEAVVAEDLTRLLEQAE